MREMKESGVQWIGTIPAHWNMVPTKRLFQVVSGATPQADQEENWDGDVIWVTPADFKTDDRDVSKGKRTLTQQGFDSCSTTLVPAGSLIFSKRAPIGAVVMNTVDLCTNQGCLSSIPYSTEATCVRYFYYVMAIATEQYELLGSGTTFKEISATNFANFVLPAPDYEEQQQIVTHLDTKCAQIDALIANVQAQMEQLKQYKQSLITEVVTKGLDPDVPMKDSGVEWIGEIPSPWTVIQLGSLSHEMRNGYVGPTRDLFVEEGVKYIQSLHTKDGVIDFDKHPYYVSEEWGMLHPKVHTGDILIVQTGDIGQVALVPPEYDGCNCHALIIVVPQQEIVIPAYLTYYLRSYTGKELVLSFKTGSLLPHLNSGKIKSAPVCVPSIDEQIQAIAFLDAKCAQIDRLLAIKQAKIAKLTEYKKSLIYEYVTGKREVVC